MYAIILNIRADRTLAPPWFLHLWIYRLHILSSPDDKEVVSHSSGGGGWGDPHYTSFDNRRYDFYAEGHYILFGVDISPGRSFFVQVRLTWPGWRASVTSALTFGIPGEYGYQVNYTMSLSKQDLSLKGARD